MARQPNVIIIITDDQGYGTVGVHGDPHVRTPNLDRLANESAEFTRFYGSPLCSPSRASLMTGRYSYRTGILHTSRGGALMSGDEVTAAELFTEAGYRTGLFGKWHLGDNYPLRPIDQGFQTAIWHKNGGIGQPPDRPNSYFDPMLYCGDQPFQAEGYCTDIFFGEALAFIESNKAHPFFVYIATNTPHTPLEISDDYAGPYRDVGIEDSVARVYGMVENIDDNIGCLLSRLSEWGLDDNTIVIFTSDHGPAKERYNAGLRSQKGDVYEGGIRVPFFMRWPVRIPEQRQIDRIAAHIDVLPTLLSLSCVETPDAPPMDGVDLSPLLNDSATDWPDRTLFVQTHRGSAPRRYHCSTAIGQKYKWLGYPGEGDIWTFDASENNPVMELYDLESDPGEKENLAGPNTKLVAQMRKDYDTWFDDVTTDWRAGTIHIGNAAENPITLCRYQDSEYRDGLPFGWRVRIERSGIYEIGIERGPFDGAGALNVNWGGTEVSASLEAGENTDRLSLAEGEGSLDVWFELDGIGRLTFSSSEPIGDVRMEWLRP